MIKTINEENYEQMIEEIKKSQVGPYYSDPADLDVQPADCGDTNLDIDVNIDVIVEAGDNAKPSNVNQTIATTLNIIDNVLSVTSDGLCSLTGAISNEQGGEVLTFQNSDTGDCNVTAVIQTGEGQATFNFGIETGGEKKIYTVNNFVVLTEEALVTSASWDATNQLFSFTADGNGTQTIKIYVNGYGVPQSVSFTPGVLTSWSYDNPTNILTAIVTYGSPHEFSVSFAIPAAATTGTGSPAGGGSGLSLPTPVAPAETPETEAPTGGEAPAETPTGGEEPAAETGTPGITGGVIGTLKQNAKAIGIIVGVLLVLGLTLFALKRRKLKK
jgi:hypothetical protein